jgi:CubicO group peptidase (beta-lactamase class C family)
LNQPQSLAGLEPHRLERIAARIGSDIAALRCDGVALCIERDGVPLYDRLHGFADRAAGRALAADDVFVSMSIGKQFTNAVVLACVEQGALSLSTAIGEVLPAFAGSADTVAVAVARLTEAEATPSRRESDFSTRPTQEAHDIPFTGKSQRTSTPPPAPAGAPYGVFSSIY